MIRKHLQERRERNRELAKRDAGCRCAFCRKVKPLQFGAFCSYDCKQDADEAAEQLREARR